jgi:membrane protein implicated in regulation of membrane protease activity
MESIFFEPWHWLVLATVLLIAEALGTGGFLIGLAMAAFLQGIVAVYYENLSWDFQLIIFAANAIIFTVIYWKFFRKFNEATDSPDINNRAAQLIGHSFDITEPIRHGEGKVQIGDSLWRIRCPTELVVGALVKVVGSDGMVLLVEQIVD